MNKQEIQQKKKIVINEQKPMVKKELLEYLEKRKIEKTCFWTWPWGHVWSKRPGVHNCLVCNIVEPYD